MHAAVDKEFALSSTSFPEGISFFFGFAGALQHDLPISAAWQADPCKLPSKFLSVPNDIVKQIFQAMSKAMSVSFGFYQGKRKTFQAAALGSSACRDR